MNEETNAAHENEVAAVATEDVAAAPEGDSEDAEEVETAAAEEADETKEDEGETPAEDAGTEVDLDGVQVVHSSDYDSNRAFSDFPLSAEILQGIEAHGYKTATAVQAATLEAALAGRDMVVRSKTGTGKTAAFSLPILEQIDSGAREVQGIVLAPTRELARQVAEEATQLAQFKDCT